MEFGGWMEVDMVQDTVKKIEDAIRRLDSLHSEERKALVSLLSALKEEVGHLSRTHDEQARSIAGLTEMAAHEATRKTKSPSLMKHSIEGLVLSTQGFETSHPKLVQITNDICIMLARIGI
ncbi:MAG TPA: hypothetical protein DEB40_05995 [Elusimicrobia bacterium]|nr:hypothetical protein [Elusimicrobiota bacterium]HBT61278.1 hypothetical protein [Elusimicrobiota bacterium]